MNGWGVAYALGLAGFTGAGRCELGRGLAPNCWLRLRKNSWIDSTLSYVLPEYLASGRRALARLEAVPSSKTSSKSASETLSYSYRSDSPAASRDFEPRANDSHERPRDRSSINCNGISFRNCDGSEANSSP